MLNKALAILFKYPNADPMNDFLVMDDGFGNQTIHEWNVKDTYGNRVPLPTEEELIQWWNEYEMYRTNTLYREQRREEYPPIGDQLDTLWKLLEPGEGTEAYAMKQLILSIKAKYPKPTV